jgi:hypothetical protein
MPSLFFLNDILLSVIIVNVVMPCVDHTCVKMPSNIMLQCSYAEYRLPSVIILSVVAPI